MGEFFDSIKNELDSLEGAGGPSFGTDFNSNAAVVRQVQQKINDAGYAPPLTVDGAYGPATAAGVKWFQNTNGLTADGIIGDQTLGALGITPPGGTSLDSVTGAAKSAVNAALSAVQSEYAPLLAWAMSQSQPLTQGKGIAPGFQATKASVVNSYIDWTTPFEGFLPFMYIDAKGLVTTGMGNLIDPVSIAETLPWKHTDGSLASKAEIDAAWSAVDSQRSDPKGQKQTSGPATKGGGTQGGLTSIRVTKADVLNLVSAKMKANEAQILKGMPNFAQAPADAQLAAHSMAWAMGPGFAYPAGTSSYYPSLVAAFNQGDYATAASQSGMHGVGIDMRNMANKLLLNNAAQVVSGKHDADTLYYITGLTQLFGAVGGASPMAIIASMKAHPYRTGGIVAVALMVMGGSIYLATRG